MSPVPTQPRVHRGPNAGSDEWPPLTGTDQKFEPLPSLGQGGDDHAVADIMLDDELLAALSRRSRRRLRDIQSTCHVQMRLDRARSTLRVLGSSAGVDAAREQLASLTGPRKAVSAAAWAELMRTRSLEDPEQAIVVRIQEETGCRVHIERTTREVRLFGPPEGTEVAARRLDELAASCSERSVEIGQADLAAEALQDLAHACRVTLRVEAGHVAALGLAENVAAAEEALRRLVAEAPPVDPGLSSEKSAKMAGSRLDWAEASNDSSDDARSIAGISPAGGAGKGYGAVVAEIPQEANPPQPRQPDPSAKAALLGKVSTSTPLDAGAAGGRSIGGGGAATAAAEGLKPWGGRKNRGAYRRERQSWPTHGSNAACSTCGVGSFCPGCGMNLWQQSAMGQMGYGYFVLHEPGKQEAGSSASTCYSETPDSEVAVPQWMQWMPFDGSFAHPQLLQEQLQEQEQHQEPQGKQQQKEPQQQPPGQPGSAAAGGGVMQQQGRMVPVYFSHGPMPQGMVPICFASGQFPSSAANYTQGGESEQPLDNAG